MRWVGLVVRMWKLINAFKILLRDPGSKTRLRRDGDTWEDNIKMDL